MVATVEKLQLMNTSVPNSVGCQIGSIISMYKCLPVDPVIAASLRMINLSLYVFICSSINRSHHKYSLIAANVDTIDTCTDDAHFRVYIITCKKAAGAETHHSGVSHLHERSHVGRPGWLLPEAPRGQSIVCWCCCALRLPCLSLTTQQMSHTRC